MIDFILLVFMISSVATFVWYVIDMIFEGAGSKTKFQIYGRPAILVCIFATSLYGLLIITDKQNAETKRKYNERMTVWRDNGCYVYKDVCGGKTKVVCEIKTNEKVRVDLGDRLMPTYPTCASEK